MSDGNWVDLPPLVDNAAEAVTSIYPHARVTSEERPLNSPLARANPNSLHNGRKDAVDIAPIEGISFDDYVSGLKNAGYDVVEARDEAKHPVSWTTGPNWHVSLAGGPKKAAAQAAPEGEWIDPQAPATPAATQNLPTANHDGEWIDNPTVQPQTEQPGWGQQFEASAQTSLMNNPGYFEQYRASAYAPLVEKLKEKGYDVSKYIDPSALAMDPLGQGATTATAMDFDQIKRDAVKEGLIPQTAGTMPEAVQTDIGKMIKSRQSLEAITKKYPEWAGLKDNKSVISWYLNHPEYHGPVHFQDTHDFDQQIKTDFQNELQKNQDVAEKSDWVPYLAGGFAGSMGDPVNAAAMLVPGGAAHGLLRRMAGDALLNAGIETTELPMDQGERAESGRPYMTPEEMATQVGMAAGGGAAFGAVMHGVGKGVGAVRDLLPETVDAVSPPSDIEFPTGDKRTKNYKAQLESARQGIESHVQNLTKDWTNKPDIEVHPDFTQLDGVNNKAVGAITPEGKVVMNTKRILEVAKRRGVSPEDVATANVFHESLGHYGLQQKFRGDLDQTMQDMYDHGPDSFKRTVDKFMTDNPNYGGKSLEIPEAVEEVLAKRSERGQMLPPKFEDKIRNMIKTLGRKTGLKMFDFNYSTREINSILAEAHDRVVNGKKVAAGTGDTKHAMYDSNKMIDLIDKSEREPGKVHFDRLWPNNDKIVDFRYVDPETNTQVYGAFKHERDTAKDFEVYGAGANSLGIKATREVRRQIKAEFPEISKLEAVRISGARNNGASVPLKEGKPIAAKFMMGEDSSRIRDQHIREDTKLRRKNEAEKLDDEQRILKERGIDPSTVGLPKDKNKYMVVHHGSRHDFDEFDIDKVGTGEGAQVYGWGLYFAENPRVAKTYKAAGLGYQRDPIYIDGKDMDVWAEEGQGEDRFARSLAAEQLDNHRGDVDSSIKELKETVNSGLIAQYRANRFNAAIAILEDLKKNNKIEVKERPKGKMYEADIQEKGNWLEWDKPWDQQSEGAIKRLKAAGLIDTSKIDIEKSRLRTEEASVKQRLEELDDQLIELAQHDENDHQVIRDKEDIERERENLQEDLEEIQKELNPTKDDHDGWGGFDPSDDRYREPPVTGETIYHAAIEKYGSPQKASKALNSHGIIGIKYLDGMSRADGTGTHNYVVFDHSNVKIKAKYMMDYDPEVDKLSPDDLFESRNALDLLRKLTRNVEPVHLTMDELKTEAENRGISLTKLKGLKPGEITRLLFMQDIAADKMSEKLSTVYAKLNSGDFTIKDRDTYISTLLKGQSLITQIGQSHSELGRAMRSIREMQFTIRKMKGIEGVLGEFLAENPIEALKDPEQFRRFAEDVQKQIEEAKSKNKNSKISQGVANALNMPRALMSSFDLSAPLRQGIFLIGRKQFYTSFAKMFTYFRSEDAYKELIHNIQNRNSYPSMQEAGLAISDLGHKLTNREDAFMSPWAEKIPFGVGRMVKASERAYTGFLNKLRADVFDDLLAKADRTGVDLYSKDNLKALGDYINNATGRGDLGKLRSSAPLLNSMFFSPRLIASRAQLLNPVAYAKMPPFVRKEALRDLMTFGAVALTVTALGAAAGMKTQLDPRSSDFGKLRLGNTRFDILGGFGQYIVFGSRLVSNQYMNSSGDLKTYGSKYGQSTRLDAAGTFARNKLAPVPSFIADYLAGKDTVGNKFTVTDADISNNAVTKRFIPLFGQDYIGLIKSDGFGKGTAEAVPGVFGVGIQNYDPKASNQMNAETVTAPVTIKMTHAPNMKNDSIEIKDGEITLSPKAQEKWKEKEDQAFKQIMKDVTTTPEWKSLDAKQRLTVTRQMKTKAYNATKQALLPELVGN